MWVHRQPLGQSWVSRPPAGLAAAAALTLAACGPAANRQGEPAPATQPAKSFAAGYLAPPDIDAADRTGASLLLRGQAPPNATVNLASPEGQHLSAQADRIGQWSITLPAPDKPDMFALSAVRGSRTVRSEGAVLVLPEPGPPALLVRAGFAAEPLAAPFRPAITALDYDRGGGAAVAGLAKPMARVRLSIDGAPAGLAQADERGRFAVLAANRPLTPGRRLLEVETDAGRLQAQADVSQPVPLGQAVYRATRQQGAWRIDWSPAGGGIQTSVVFDRTGPVGAAP